MGLKEKGLPLEKGESFSYAVFSRIFLNVSGLVSASNESIFLSSTILLFFNRAMSLLYETPCSLEAAPMRIFQSLRKFLLFAFRSRNAYLHA